MGGMAGGCGAAAAAGADADDDEEAATPLPPELAPRPAPAALALLLLPASLPRSSSSRTLPARTSTRAARPSPLAQPRQPQCWHSMISPGARLARGTRHLQVVPKFVSRVCTQRKQHRRSYPGFFHFAIKFWSAV